MSSIVPIEKVVERFVDPQYYGGVIAICMFGLCISQTWTYIHTNDDRWPLQVTVAFLFIFVFGCTILDAAVLHHYLIAQYGNIIALTRITPEVSIFALFTLIVIVTSDITFATRVWRLRRIHWTITAAIALTAIGALIPGISLVNALLQSPLIDGLGDFHRKLEVGFVNILAAVSQCMSTFGLWYSFQAHIDEMPPTPRSVLQRLRNVVVNRGALLTLCQLLVAFLYFNHPERLYWSPFHQFLAPLYYSTMLATLNARRPERAQPWETTSSLPASPSVCSPSALESGIGRAGLGNEMRMRMGMGITPFPSDDHTSGFDDVRENHLSRRNRRSLPRQAFAALNADIYRKRLSSLSKKIKKKPEEFETPPKEKILVCRAPVRKLESVANEGVQITELPPRRLPSIPTPALVPVRTT